MTRRPAHHLFDEMRRYLSRASSSPPETRQLHALLLTTGLFSDERLATRLLSQYANAYCFSDADLVLASVADPDLFSFSTLIHAFSRLANFTHSLSTFSLMLSAGVFPDRYLFPSVIKACSGLRSTVAGKQAHAFAYTFGFSSDAFIQSSLLHMYIKCDRITDARKVFDGFPKPDLVSCSAMISGLANHGLLSEAEQMLDRMRRKGVEPNTVTWNGLISGFNRFDSGLAAFQRMHSEGFSPDSGTISTILPAVRDAVSGAQVQCHATKAGVSSDKCVGSATVDMYGKLSLPEEMSKAFGEAGEAGVGVFNAYVTGLSRNGKVEEALAAVAQRQRSGAEMNTVTWTSAIAGCSQSGRDSQALELFREMQGSGARPNAVTIPCVLPACGNLAALSHGRAAHAFAVRGGFADAVFVASALVRMYSACGRLPLARLVFDSTPAPNLPCWNAVISAYASHGLARDTISLFRSITQNPDAITFTCLLSACAQKGLVDEGMEFFSSMEEAHGVQPTLAHYGCVVTLLARAGRLEEALSFAAEMPMEPDASVWGSLLSSCRVHGDVGLAELAAEKLFAIEPGNAGNYVMLSNVYAAKGMWREADRARAQMRRNGVRKNPGCSWIEVRSEVHVLLSGDRSHPQMEAMVEKVRKLSVEMKKVGYAPEVESVLQDVDEDEKELILCGHSEKLALSLGLINAPPGTCLRVFKNLRICGDCHTFIKFVSAFEAREILVRDTNRFHHFKDGECSCGDFW